MFTILRRCAVSKASWPEKSPEVGFNQVQGFSMCSSDILGDILFMLPTVIKIILCCQAKTAHYSSIKGINTKLAHHDKGQLQDKGHNSESYNFVVVSLFN